MLKFLGLFSCWLLLSGSISQAPPAAFSDTPVITKNSVGQARIGMPLLKLKETYKGCSFNPDYLSKYGFDEYGSKPDATLVSRDGQKLFVFWLDTQTKKVAGIFALNPAYHTAQGIHVGSTAGQLKKVLPAVRVGPNELNTEMQIADIERGEYEKMGIQYVFFKQGILGKDKDSIVPSAIAVPNAKISWIQVFPN